MRQVSMVEFRRNAASIIRRVERGERIVLTRRGRPVLQLEPVDAPAPSEDDPIYELGALAVEGEGTLTDREIDEIVYGR